VLCILVLWLTGIPISIADQTKPIKSGVPPGASHPLEAEIRETSPSNSPPTQPNIPPRPWWIGDLITLLGIVVGVIIVIYQLGRQHKSELKLQRENYREHLRLNIYQQFSKLLDAAIHKNIDSHLYASMIPMHVHTYCDVIKKGFSHSPLEDRAAELSKLHHESLKAATELIFMVERHQIVDPRLDIFRTAIGVAHHDMMETFRPLFSFLLEILPGEISRPDGSHTLINVITPSDYQVNELERLVNAYKTASFDMECYFYDLNVELQNTLLCNLFPNKVPRRKPLDPRFKVISTEPNEMKRLQKYFEEETDWGKMKKKTEQDVLSELDRPKPDSSANSGTEREQRDVVEK
jgi:hypothetical protein